jgi:hypothetical protein
MKLFYYILALVVLTGCGGGKRPLATTVSTLDSTHVIKRVQERDTIVRLPFYKVGLVIHQDELGEEPVSRKSGNARLEMYKKNDSIYASAECDSLELQLKLRDSIISTYRNRKTDTTITLPPEEIEFVPWPVKMLAWLGGILLLYLVIRLGIKFIKPV